MWHELAGARVHTLTPPRQRGELLEPAEARRERTGDAGLGEAKHGEAGAVADLRGQRAVDVLVVAATEHLEAGHPADGRQNPLGELVVIDDELYGTPRGGSH